MRIKIFFNRVYIHSCNLISAEMDVKGFEVAENEKYVNRKNKGVIKNDY